VEGYDGAEERIWKPVGIVRRETDRKEGIGLHIMRRVWRVEQKIGKGGFWKEMRAVCKIEAEVWESRAGERAKEMTLRRVGKCSREKGMGKATGRVDVKGENRGG